MPNVCTINGKTKINVDGLTIEYSDGKISIEGLDKKRWRKGKSRDKHIFDKDGTVNGDVNGNVEITGNNITIVIKGDVIGNIVGSADIQIQGDINGNIVGGRIR